MHMHQCCMFFDEADILEQYLLRIKGVIRVKVSERTADVTVFYCRDEISRDELIDAFAVFHYDEHADLLPEHSGRRKAHEYEDKMFWHVARHLAVRLFLPLPVRILITCVKDIPFVIRAVQSLSKGKLDVHVLDAVSVTIAMLQKDFDTAGSVMFLLGIGDIMEEWIRRRSVDDLADAMSLHADKVWMKNADGQEVLVGIDQMEEGDVFVVRSGNMIPLDGIVASGEAMVNQALITGEPLSVRKSDDAAVFAGTVVEEGEISVRVTKGMGHGQYDRIVSMIEESEKLRSETESRALDLADRLVPWTFAATLLTFAVTRNITKAYSVLMVDFCCALKLSIPLSVLSAMKEASKRNILVKGGKFMEDCAKAETIIFDKTGTLTKTQPRVKDVIAFDGNDPEKMLLLAACLEEHYPHTIANAVVREAKDRGLTHDEKHSRVEYIVAHGIASEIDGLEVRIGSYHFIFEDEKAVIAQTDQEKFESLPEGYSYLYMAIEKKLSAVILIEDPIKEEAEQAIRLLHANGFKNVVMLTGDSAKTAKTVAKQLGIDDFQAEVLPADKAAYIEKEHKLGHKVVMVGDGINDSPALSAADVGVAINSGAAIAREVADVTISDDDLLELVELRKLCNLLHTRIKRNYRFILGFNSTLIVLAIAGILSPSLVALLHNSSTIAISIRSVTGLLPENS